MVDVWYFCLRGPFLKATGSCGSHFFLNKTSKLQLKIKYTESVLKKLLSDSARGPHAYVLCPNLFRESIFFLIFKRSQSPPERPGKYREYLHLLMFLVTSVALH